MHHLVTGGSGFVGWHLAKALRRRGEAVTVLDPRPLPEPLEGVAFVQGDVRDRALLARVMPGVDVVQHNAAQVPLTKDLAGFRSVNVEGTRAVLEAAAAAGVRHLVHMSSSAVFGLPERCPIDAGTPLRPVEAYGESKLEAEREALRAGSRGLAVTVIRPRTLVGPDRLGIFGILFDWIRSGKRVWVIGPGTGRFQLLHVSDLVEACLAAPARGARGAYNLGAARFGTLRGDLEALIAHAGTRARVRSVPAWAAIPALAAADRAGLSPLAPWHYLTYHKAFHFDLVPAERDLGFAPRFSNLEMLSEAYDGWRASEGSATGGSPHRRGVRYGVLSLLKKVS